MMVDRNRGRQGKKGHFHSREGFERGEEKGKAEKIKANVFLTDRIKWRDASECM